MTPPYSMCANNPINITKNTQILQPTPLFDEYTGENTKYIRR